MPNNFLSPEGDLEEHFITDYWLIDQYVGDQLWAWGTNNFAQIGDNTAASRSTATIESTLSTNWAQVSCGGRHTLAIKSDGTLWCWGRNTSGELGDNTNLTRSTPRQISAGASGITGWKQVSGGANHSAAIRTNGTLWLWGNNGLGQLGDNTIIFKSVPTQISISSVGGAFNWKHVSCGYNHIFALREDGTLWGWGSGFLGQVGDNTNQVRSSPRQISAGATRVTGWKSVDCNLSNVTAAIATDETLWIWGSGTLGQMGDNTNVSKSIPKQVSIASAGGLNGWKQVSPGGGTVSAIRTNGTLWSWGQNANGQIGDNTIIPKSIPTQELTLSNNWKYIASGYKHVIAIKTDGTLWSWGQNTNGHVGDNTIQSRSTPRQEVTSATNWKQVSGGYFHTAAIKSGVELN